MRHILNAAIFAATANLMIAPAQSALLVDTGQPTLGHPSTISPLQSIAGYFTVGSAVTIHSVEGLFRSQGGSTITLTIYGDAPVPTTALFSTTFISSFSNDAAGAWQGAFGLDWDLAAGSYWVGYDGTGQTDAILGPVPNPLARYAVGRFGSWEVVPAPYSVGVRIAGIGTGPGPIPEPSTWAMLIVGFGLTGAALRSRPRVKISYAQ